MKTLEDKKTTTAENVVDILEASHLKQDAFVGMGSDTVYVYVKKKRAVKAIQTMFDDYANVVVQYHGPVVVKG